MKHKPHFLPTGSFLIVAMPVTLGLMASLVLNSIESQKLSSTDMFKLFVLSLSLSCNLLTLFYSGFTNAMSHSREKSYKDHHVMLGSIGVAQGAIMFMSLKGRVSPNETLLAVSVFQIWSTFLFFTSIARFLEPEKNTLRFLAPISAIAVASYAVIAFPLRNWYPVTTLTNNSAIWHTLVAIMGLTAVIATTAWPKGSSDGLSRKALFVASLASPLLVGASLFAIFIWDKFFNTSQEAQIPSWIVAGYSFMFTPGLLLSWAKLRAQSEKHLESSIASKFAGNSAKRFLKKNIRDEDSWAASIGLRTAIFTVDHDPDDRLIRALPSSLVQIRNEEIVRCINDILGGRTLHNQAINQKIVGALDPEQSSRPCIDVVKLFAALYLDAGPLIERRINGLGALLPIINPGLAGALRADNVSELLKRAQWFFHFDYRWVDQNLINTPNTTRYGVQMDPQSNELSQAMIQHLKRKNALGSFLWLGRDAQARLIQEAPMLASIIEPVTISGPGGIDHLVFTLKFETLIPRLQRYFELDSLRNVLLDYEVSSDAAKLLNIFKVQSSQAKSPEMMVHLVESVASYPWRGFKEKDQALKIIVAAHQYASQLMIELDEKGTPVPRALLDLRDSVQLNVEKIGYPSQILHLAQMNKIALRDIDNLIMSARDVRHPRFEESWTLLGNLDLTRYPRPERKLIADLLSEQGTIHKLIEKPDIQAKVVDAIISLARAELQLKDFTLGVEKTLAGLVEGLMKKEPTAETLTILLDGLTFLSELSGRAVPNIDSECMRHTESLVLKYSAGSGHYAQALGNRWLERTQKLRRSEKAA